MTYERTDHMVGVELSEGSLAFATLTLRLAMCVLGGACAV